ncbi:MAG: nitrogen regulation protein NR(II) [Gammaproteobacteria bacterium]
MVVTMTANETTATEVLDALAAGVVLLDATLCIETANAAAERLLRTTRAQLAGRALHSALRDADALHALCQRAGEENRTVVLREFAIHPANSLNPTVTVDVYASPHTHGRVLLEILDNELQVQIERENRLREQRGIGRTIARQLAHEIKNPLGGLRGAAQLLAKRLGTRELTDFTDVIIRESDRLVALVDTMLGPTGPTNYSIVNVHQLLQHVATLVQAEAGDELRIVEDYDPSLPDIRLDQDQIIQAFLNVVRNALQAIDGEGTITLRTRAVTGFTIAEKRHSLVVRIDIMDSGPGIDPTVRDRMFLPLVTHRPQGTGLGLPVAQDLVSRHGGLINVTSDTPTVFSLYLPYLRAGAAHGDSSP